MFETRALLEPGSWKIEKIGVVGPGTVGMTMAAVLAGSKIRIGSEKPASVVCVQRKSDRSGWKIDAINNGHPSIGSGDPLLQEITARAVREGLLHATHDYEMLCDADVILVCVKTGIRKMEPDYKTLLNTVKDLARALRKKPSGKIPLVIFESTLAPTSISTVIWDLFDKNGLTEGRNILIGYSPSRIVPGNPVESLRNSCKLAGGLHQETGKLISLLYRNIVTGASVYETNCLTAELVKTSQSAYKDVRMAFSAEIAWLCGNRDIDFYSAMEIVNKRLRKKVNADVFRNCPDQVRIVSPPFGTGQKCISNDGMLLWWRYNEAGNDSSSSIILKALQINEESPVINFRQAENYFGKIKGSRIAVLGVSSAKNEGITDNSPILVLANYLKKKRFNYILHDPFINKDALALSAKNQVVNFTSNLDEAIRNADYVFICTAHDYYKEYSERLVSVRSIKGIMDTCNIFNPEQFYMSGVEYARTGRGKEAPTEQFIDFIIDSMLCIERGLASELSRLVEFYNDNFVFDSFNKVKFSEVYELSPSCSDLCHLADHGKRIKIPVYKGFQSKLVENSCKKRVRYERFI